MNFERRKYNKRTDVPEEVRIKERERSRRFRLEHPDIIKEYKLRHLYGITLQDYRALLELQAGQCAVCGRKRPLHVDHDHETMKIRGLLCEQCNAAEGLLGNAENVKALLSYLEMNK